MIAPDNKDAFHVSDNCHAQFAKGVLRQWCIIFMQQKSS